jgi:hypothetical protein
MGVDDFSFFPTSDGSGTSISHSSELDLKNEVAGKLEDHEWAVERETVFGPVQVDIFARVPNASRAFAIEIKLGVGQETHFTVMAEMKDAARKAERGTDVDNVVPVLVTNYAVSPVVQMIADKLGVEIVKVDNSAPIASDEVVRWLDQDPAARGIPDQADDSGITPPGSF